MGTRISAVGFDIVSLEELIRMTVKCAQIKIKKEKGDSISEVYYKWYISENIGLVAISLETISELKNNIYLKNIFPFFKSENITSFTVHNVEKNKNSSEVKIKGQILHIPCTFYLANYYEVSLRKIKESKRISIVLSAMGYYGNIKKQKITAKDKEDGIDHLLQLQGYIYPALYEENEEEEEEYHDYFIYGRILEFKFFQNPYTKEKMVSLRLGLDKIELPILLSCKDIENISDLKVGNYFEGSCWLQGIFIKKERNPVFKKSMDFKEEKNIEVVAIEEIKSVNNEMRDAFLFRPLPINCIIKKEERYFKYNTKGEIERPFESLKDLNDYIDNYQYKWISFFMKDKSVVFQKNTGEIYIDEKKLIPWEGVQYTEHFIILGNIMYKNKKYLEASLYYDKALRLNEHIFNVYLYRAYSQEILQQWEKAIQDYEKLLEIDPKNHMILSRVKEIKKDLN